MILTAHSCIASSTEHGLVAQPIENASVPFTSAGFDPFSSLRFVLILFHPTALPDKVDFAR